MKAISELSEFEINYWVGKAQNYPMYDRHISTASFINKEQLKQPILMITREAIYRRYQFECEDFSPCTDWEYATKLASDNNITWKYSNDVETFGFFELNTPTGVVVGTMDKSIMHNICVAFLTQTFGDAVPSDE